MFLAASWKAMNRERVLRVTGEPKTVRIQVGTEPGVNRVPAIRRRDIHALATRGAS
jgi:hypothetical protein